MKKIYLSGKITGIEDEAIELFAKAETEVRKMGFEPVNPLSLNHNHDKSWQSYLRVDIQALCDCDIIFLLHNWKDSEGAQLELTIANCLEMPVMQQR